MTNIRKRIFALECIENVLTELNYAKQQQHKYDYETHSYTDELTDTDSQEKIEIIQCIEDKIIELIALKY